MNSEINSKLFKFIELLVFIKLVFHLQTDLIMILLQTLTFYLQNWQIKQILWLYLLRFWALQSPGMINIRMGKREGMINYCDI